MYFKSNLEQLKFLILCVLMISLFTTELTYAKGSEQNPLELTKSSSLADYLAYAALNNPGLKAEFLRWKAELEKIPQVKAMPDPRFNYTYLIQNVETRVGPQRQKLGLMQMFPWFGKLRLKGDIALEMANVQQQKYEAAKLKLFFQVKKAYYDYYYLGQSINITRENMELMTYLEEVARTKYTTGTAPHAVVIKAQVELGKLEDRLRSLEDMKNPVMARLNAALNRPSDAFLPVPDSIEVYEIHQSDIDLLSQLEANNPSLKAINFMAAKEEKAIELAKKQGMPDFTIGFDFMETGEAIMPNTIDSGKDPIGLMVSMNIPIWRGKYKAAEREAYNRYSAARQDHVNKENTLSADLKMTLYGYRDADRKVELYGHTLLPKADQALNVTQQAFIAGKADFLDLIDAQRTLLEFELAHQKALSAKATKFAQIEMLIGNEITR